MQTLESRCEELSTLSMNWQTDKLFKAEAQTLVNELTRMRCCRDQRTDQSIEGHNCGTGKLVMDAAGSVTRSTRGALRPLGDVMRASTPRLRCVEKNALRKPTVSSRAENEGKFLKNI